MPKYNVNVSFSLRTLIEPDGIRFDRDTPEGVEDFSDESYFRNCEVDADGGNIIFTVTADSEEDAERISEEIVYDSMEVEDDNGFTWQVDDRSVEIEEVEIPMDLDRAKLLVTDYLDQMEGMDDELKLAFGFLLEVVSVQQAEIRRQSEALSGARSTIAALESQVLRLQGENVTA